VTPRRPRLRLGPCRTGARSICRPDRHRRVGARSRTAGGNLPIGWMLLTTWPVEDVAAAETVVHYDSYRWRLGRSHDVLKREGHIEDPPLETFDRLDQALAVCRIVAWRPRWLTDLARDQPEAPLSHRLASRRVGGLVCRPHPPPGSAARAGGSTHRCAVMASPGSKPPVPSPACNYPGCGIPPPTWRCAEGAAKHTRELIRPCGYLGSSSALRARAGASLLVGKRLATAAAKSCPASSPWG